MAPSLLVPLLLGIPLGLLYVGFVRTRPDAGRRALAWGLVVAAGVYPAVAVVAARGGPGPAGGATVALEALGLAVFGAVAWRGAREAEAPVLSARWLALGWLAHPLWDLPHLVGGGGGLLGAYAALCLTFDPLAAAGALAIARRRPGPRRGATRTPAPASPRGASRRPACCSSACRPPRA